MASAPTFDASPTTLYSRRELLTRAERFMPGGVSSPVRAFRSVGGEPIFVRAADGAYLEAVEGRKYLDYIGGYGPHILGHGHPAIIEAVKEALSRGTSFGAPTVEEVDLAEKIGQALPSMEMVRLVNSGTEACMSALRLARAATGRSKVVKFIGCYHGHADAFLVAAGSGAKTFGSPSSPGVPAAVVADTLLAPYNDLETVAELFRRHPETGRGGGVAAVIVEPVAGNMNLVPPKAGFLPGLRRLCDDHGAVLIFDEVMTGFRVAHSGAQGLYQVRPDLTCLGKVIGGGLPIAAYGGARVLMEQVSPSGPVYQAGTLSGNPLAVAAGTAALDALAAEDGAAYLQLEATGKALEVGLARIAAEKGLDCQVSRVGAMLGFVLTDSPVENLADVDAGDHRRFNALFHSLLSQGVHLPPSPYEAWFYSTAHGEREVARTLDAFATACDAARAVDAS